MFVLFILLTPTGHVNPSHTANQRYYFSFHVWTLKKTPSNPNFWHQPNANRDKSLKCHVTLCPCFHKCSDTGAQFMGFFINKKTNRFWRSEIQLCWHAVYSLPRPLFHCRGLSLKVIYRHWNPILWQIPALSARAENFAESLRLTRISHRCLWAPLFFFFLSESTEGNMCWVASLKQSPEQTKREYHYASGFWNNSRP